jgi:hypothetical protein
MTLREAVKSGNFSQKRMLRNVVRVAGGSVVSSVPNREALWKSQRLVAATASHIRKC